MNVNLKHRTTNETFLTSLSDHGHLNGFCWGLQAVQKITQPYDLVITELDFAKMAQNFINKNSLETDFDNIMQEKIYIHTLDSILVAMGRTFIETNKRPEILPLPSSIQGLLTDLKTMTYGQLHSTYNLSQGTLLYVRNLQQTLINSYYRSYHKPLIVNLIQQTVANALFFDKNVIEVNYMLNCGYSSDNYKDETTTSLLPIVLSKLPKKAAWGSLYVTAKDKVIRGINTVIINLTWGGMVSSEREIMRITNETTSSYGITALVYNLNNELNKYSNSIAPYTAHANTYENGIANKLIEFNKVVNNLLSNVPTKELPDVLQAILGGAKQAEKLAECFRREGLRSSDSETNGGTEQPSGGITDGGISTEGNQSAVPASGVCSGSDNELLRHQSQEILAYMGSHTVIAGPSGY